jgi:predicted GH43/DUF377 family glycosyl hydrolase
MKLQRISNKPILEPRANIPWEKSAVLNAAAIHDGSHFHLFYRAVAHNPGSLNESCIGHAISRDGIHFDRFDTPILANKQAPEESRGVEDPRITKIGDTYHLSYVAWDTRRSVISRATSNDLKTWTRRGIMFPYEQFGNNKNAALFPEKIGGRYALIHRPMGFAWDDHDYPLDMWMSFSDDLKQWDGHRRLLRARRGEIAWEHGKIGLGGAPHKTARGWLMIYHAMAGNTYRLGCAMLDIKDPTKVLWRTDEPILEPELDWEKNGDVSNVVFTCGSVLLGDELWVYYCGADSRIGLAKCIFR